MAESAGFNAAPEARAARAARFDASTAETRYRKLEAKRTDERRKLEEAGAINSGQTELQDAVDVRGTCETKCSEFEAAFREFTGEINPLEKDASGRPDPRRMVAAYTRSDAGAGLGAAAKLPSDLRTPTALVNSLDYLVDELLPTQPPGTIPSLASHRRSLGYVSGFIRDRTRAIRKEFSLQTSWGSLESVECHEKIARYHILALRELQEETGGSSDMHNDSAELGRCFTSLRQLYEDLAEDYELPNRAEMQAYMLLFDLRDKFTAISASQLPSAVFNDTLVKTAFEFRKAAQCNFDTQKEGSKDNAELGLNAIRRYIHLLRQPNVPFLLSCLAEIRLRELRRSALRALRGIYLTAKDPLVIRDGQVVEKRLMKVDDLIEMLGCEKQEEELPAFDDVKPISRDPVSEAKQIVESLGFTFVIKDGEPIGALINKGADYKDNNDAPYTRRWASITAKRQGLSFVDIVHGRVGVRSGSQVSSTIPNGVIKRTSVPSSAFHFSALPQPTPQAPQSFSFTPAAKADPAPQITTSLFPTLAPASTTPKHPPPAVPAFNFQLPASTNQPPETPAQPASKPFTFDFSSTKPALTAEVPLEPAQTVPPLSFSSAQRSSPILAFPPEEKADTSVDAETPATQKKDSLGLIVSPAPLDVVERSEGPQYSAQDLALSVPQIFSAIWTEVLSTVFDKDIYYYRSLIDDEVAERRAIAEAEAALAKQEEEEEEEEEQEMREEEEREERLYELRETVLSRKFLALWRSLAAERAALEAERIELNNRIHHLGLGGNVWRVPLYRPPSPVHDDLDIEEPLSTVNLTPAPEDASDGTANGDYLSASISTELASTFGVFEDHVIPLPLQSRPTNMSPKRKRVWDGYDAKDNEEDKAESSRVKLMRLEKAMRAASRLITT